MMIVSMKMILLFQILLLGNSSILLSMMLISRHSVNSLGLLPSFRSFQLRISSHIRGRSAPDLFLSQNTVDIDSLKLPSRLRELAEGLRQVRDDKLRYQQLLFLASKAQMMPAELKTIENKVQGCLSTVHVHATMDESGRINYLGDSDAMLTKGLVVVLVQGLSGSTAEEIIEVKPEFIAYAGIASSLTPGRNNGFLNMLKLMKSKAVELKNQRTAAATAPSSSPAAAIASDEQIKVSAASPVAAADPDRPIYTSIVKKLSMLKPALLEVEDESYKHAGHAEVLSSSSSSGESHFQVRIIAQTFEGMSLVQRHKMIYTLLAQEMSNGIHALSIEAKTPKEVDSSKKTS
jgi:BolA-like protein 1